MNFHNDDSSVNLWKDPACGVALRAANFQFYRVTVDRANQLRRFAWSAPILWKARSQAYALFTGVIRMPPVCTSEARDLAHSIIPLKMQLSPIIKHQKPHVPWQSTSIIERVRP